MRQHRPVYLECLIGARDPQLVDQLGMSSPSLFLAAIFIAIMCSADAPVTIRPGVLKTVLARWSLAGGMNSLAFSLSQFGSRPYSAAISSAAASTSSFACSLRASTSRVVRARPYPTIIALPPTT